MIPLNQMHIFQKYVDDMAHAKTPMFFQPLNALMIKKKHFPVSTLSIFAVCPASLSGKCLYENR